MRARTLLSILGAIIALTAAYVVITLSHYSPTASDVPAAPDGPDVAYALTTADEFVLLRGHSILARVERPWDPVAGAIVWTSTGRRVAFLSVARPDDEPGNVELISIDTTTGQQHRVPCSGCIDLAAADGDRIVALVVNQSLKRTKTEYYRSDVIAKAARERKVQLVQYELGQDAPHIVGTPMASGAHGLVAGTTNYLLSFARVETRAGKVDRHAITAHADGRGWRLEKEGIRQGVSSIGATKESMLVRPHDYASCSSSPSVTLLEMDGEVHDTDLSALKPPDAKPNEWSGSVSDIWWGLDGKYHATFAAWRCVSRDNDPKIWKRSEQDLVTPHSLWTLDASTYTWHREPEFPPAGAIRFIGDGEFVALVKPDCIGAITREESADKKYCSRGTLYRHQRDGTTVKVADDVLSVASGPALHG
ncbi:hypothetical protein IU459_16160 [Nocardia amamiensis]|uniref:Uncharacterized protein n=1 Tax=Nocardia amamiensis TaxID=404578 RepID=A0ABS0CR18_9NOCA|nr:hypothetical protein [Nocardia amamiensis]MBF6299064.1 hypothetical protein [Nocardia amamiensis]